ncbi:MAG: ArgE/DapE family deacylase [Thermoprotei archaeon]
MLKVNEIAKLLSGLLKIDTTNPPGNETEAAKYLSEWLAERGIKSEIIECDKNRGNLIARIHGTNERPSLLLLSHLDVVPADPSRWRVHPFSGIIKDEYVWGRGALDMKSMVALETYIFAELASMNKQPKGDIILAATAGEERGGIGVQWLLNNARNKILANYVINEGGGDGIQTKSGWLFSIQVAEKGVFWHKIRTKGAPAHGSIPTLGINAIEKMNLILSRLLSFKPKIELTEQSKKYIETLLKMEGLLEANLTEDNLDLLLNKLAEKDKGLSEYLRAMTRITMTPTIIRGGVKENVLPHECELTIDCRVTPGHTSNSIKKIIQDLYSGLEYEFEFIHEAEPTWSPINTPLFEILENSIKKYMPNAQVAPHMITGGTDSRYFRALGIPAYGFQPLMIEGSYSEWAKLIHGDNERISIRNLEFGYKVLSDAIKTFMY